VKIDAMSEYAGFPSKEFSIRTRAGNLARMQSETFDLAVIGGGITGAGVALDAASRGLSVALVEKRDFASGTSSRSSKLIHGGLRYLEQFEFMLVREALHERATLKDIAPHLAEPLPFLVPVYERGKPSPLGSNKLKLRIGLGLYDFLAGKRNIAPHRWLARKELLKMAPALNDEGLRGGFLYYDCLTDDSRLVIEVIKAAARRGAAIANYTAARGFQKSGERISALEAEDSLTGNRFLLRATVFVNAAGVWSEEVARMIGESASIRIRPSKGIHILVPQEKIQAQAAVLIPSIGEQRFLFVIPWHGRTLIGTTDTDYRGSLDDPQADEEEILRVVESAARAFPVSHLSREDVISAFAGLRPLVAGNDDATKDLSRKDEIIENPSGLITVTGGKLTTYRRMAERVVDAVYPHLEKQGRVFHYGPHLSLTKYYKLTRGTVSREKAEKLASRFNLPVETIDHLMRSYGGNFRTVLKIALKSGELKLPLIEGLPHIRAEAVYAGRYEMAASVEDFLYRRTRIALLARDHGSECYGVVSEILERERDRGARSRIYRRGGPEQMNDTPFLEEKHRQLAGTVERFNHKWLPLMPTGAAEDVQARWLVGALATEGLLQYTTCDSSSSLDVRALCIIRERLSYHSALADLMFVMQGLGSFPILVAGSKELKERFLSRVRTGDMIAAFAITEPEAGSDVSAIKTVARREGSKYILNGRKTFISNAGLADFYTVFAKTDMERGAKGISAFVVERDAPGFSFEGRIDLIAPHPIGAMAFNECRIPASNLLGKEGEGFHTAMRTLDTFRPTVGAAALGLASRALDEAVSYAKRRVQFGRPIAEFQATQMKLAEMATELEAARLLVYRAAWKKDSGAERVSMESAMAKLYATEAAQRIIDHAVQIHGGAGVVSGAVVERLYREVRALRIYEGTSEIQKLIIASQLLKQ
jgi:acyl-CoA dehydrogenase